VDTKGGEHSGMYVLQERARYMLGIAPAHGLRRKTAGA
jgi:hypothetical protein